MNDSKVLKEGKFVKDVESLTAKNCEALIFALSIEEMRTTYLEATLYIDGQEYSSTTVLFTQPKHFEFLNSNLQTNVIEEHDSFVIYVSADAFAKYVELDLSDADCKFSNNYFDISAGDTKTLVVNKSSLSEPLTLQTFKDQLVIRCAYDIANEKVEVLS